MGKILKIEESKIVVKNKVEMQRVIFSNDKIVYVRLDTGDVCPANTPDKYVDLIDTYNASHDNIDSTRPKIDSNSFWGEDKSYIKDGTEDRQSEIQAAKNLKKLSKNKETQAAINRIRDFGTVLLTVGIISIVLMSIVMIFGISAYSRYSGGSLLDADNSMALVACAISIIIDIVYIVLGVKTRKLQYRPSSIKAVAISIIILGVLDLIIAGAVGLLEIFAIIYAIIALVKIGRYEEWYFGEVE